MQQEQSLNFADDTPDGNPFVATFETGKHYMVHRSYIYVAPVVAVIAALFFMLINGHRPIIDLVFAIKDGEISVNPLLAIGAIVLGFIVLVAVFVALYALSWKNMSYVFDHREFSFYSGIITKRRVHVPYARVQSVNHRASIIQRLFGVCTVTVDSAGGSSNKGVRVPYLRLETAERMRAELFMRKAAVAAGAENAIAYNATADTHSAQGAQAEAERMAQQSAQKPVSPHAQAAQQAPKAEAANTLDDAVGAVGHWRGLYGGEALFGEEPVTHEYGLSNRELLLTTISHDKPLIVAFVVALTFIMTFAFALLAQDEFSKFLASFAFATIAGATIITWVFGLLTVLFSYGNFRARRRGTRIEVERGLLAREFSGIDIERVQSIEIRQSFIRRIIGYCEISLGRIDAAGEQKSGNNNSKANTKGLVIHPFVKIDRVNEILDGLAPELASRPRKSERTPLPKPALRRAVLRRCLWFNWMLWTTIVVVVCWAIIAALFNTGVIVINSPDMLSKYGNFMLGSLTLIIALCIIVTVGNAVSAVFWARHSGYIWNRWYLLVHNDGLSTSTSVIPRQKLQSGNTRSNPFQRRLSLSTIQAMTAAGTRSSMARLIDVPQDAGNEYLDWLKPHR